jgi:hypothetical protein
MSSSDSALSTKFLFRDDRRIVVAAIDSFRVTLTVHHTSLCRAAFFVSMGSIWPISYISLALTAAVKQQI